MKRISTLVAIVIGVFLLFYIPSSCAADPDVQTILLKMKAAFEPEIASTRTLTFLIKDHGNVTTTWSAREARKKLPDGKRTLLVIIKPQEA